MINPVQTVSRRLHVAPWVIEAYFQPMGAVNGVTAIQAEAILRETYPAAAISADEDGISLPLAFFETGQLTLDEAAWLDSFDDREEHDD